MAMSAEGTGAEGFTSSCWSGFLLFEVRRASCISRVKASVFSACPPPRKTVPCRTPLLVSTEICACVRGPIPRVWRHICMSGWLLVLACRDSSTAKKHSLLLLFSSEGSSDRMVYLSIQRPRVDSVLRCSCVSLAKREDRVKSFGPSPPPV